MNAYNKKQVKRACEKLVKNMQIVESRDSIIARLKADLEELE